MSSLGGNSYFGSSVSKFICSAFHLFPETYFYEGLIVSIFYYFIRSPNVRYCLYRFIIGSVLTVITVVTSF